MPFTPSVAWVPGLMFTVVNAPRDHCAPPDRDLIEVRISVDVRYPAAAAAAATELTTPQAHVLAGGCYYVLVLAIILVLVFAVLNCVQTGLQQATEHAPGFSRIFPGHPPSNPLRGAHSPPAQPAADDDSDTPLRHSKSRSAVVQAPEPANHNGTRRAGYQRAPSTTSIAREGGTRGLSPLVIQTTDLPQGQLSKPSTRIISVIFNSFKEVNPTLLDNAALPISPAPVRDNTFRDRGAPMGSVRPEHTDSHSWPNWRDSDLERLDVWVQDEENFGPAHSQHSAAEQVPRSPLTKTLLGCDLTKLATRLLVLAVGVGGKDLPGPDHDVQWLGRLFSAAVFYAARGPCATQKGIRSALKHMFENAVESAAVIVLYFTGHGNNNNAFELHDGQSIDEATVFEWIDELRTTTGKQIPVFLAFDFCRENEVVLPVSTDQLEQVHVIWACMPGQRSYEIKLDDDLPYSDLLKAVCLAVSELLSPTTQSSGYFMGGLIGWVSRITKIHQAIICGPAGCDPPWNRCSCDICRGGGMCVHSRHPGDDPPIQRPVGWFSGFGVSI
ncbi:hypothetical protein FRC10_010034 [Ceratobasidium sp. 414]|nr:hypothetical protein FRC10_010034 [Ceratobasidium sp. 414]